VRKTAALATIVVERVVDGVMVAGFLAVALVFMPRTHAESFDEIRIGTYVALVLFGGLVVALVVLYAFRRQVSDLVRRLMGHASGKWAHRLGGLTDRFLMGLSIFPDVKNFLWFLAGSFCYWCSNGIGLWILAIGFDLGQVGLLGAFAMMSTIVIGMMIPNAPANVGSFWYFLLKPCELYGVAPGDPAGLAYALSVWSMQLLQLLVFGGYYVLRGKVSWRRAFAVGGDTAKDERIAPT
jgi:glycosyltransferase 2 family protein